VFRLPLAPDSCALRTKPGLLPFTEQRNFLIGECFTTANGESLARDVASSQPADHSRCPRSLQSRSTTAMWVLSSARSAMPADVARLKSS
jgi:hypothetical protein